MGSQCMMSTVVLVLSTFAIFLQVTQAWGSDYKEKVYLEDIKTLTLYHGRMTTGRRSRSIPQLQCIGGTAGCSAFVPQVVQCYNRGHDGYDIQWECKTDMDNSYRFGKIEVACEGYDRPDDKYVLRGSCGLEYTIDLTEEGIKKKGGHSYYGGGNSYFGSDRSYQTQNIKTGKSTRLGDVILIAVIIIIVYALYKTLSRPQQSATGSYGSDDSGSYSAPPPPPGFRPGYGGNDPGCSGPGMYSSGPGMYSSGPSMYSSRPNSGAGGFWSGAMTGGLLGYMFGSRNSGPQQSYRYSDANSNTSWGGTSHSAADHGSSGTRTASGFGGTKRR